MKLFLKFQSTCVNSNQNLPLFSSFLPSLIKAPILEKPCQLNPINDPILINELIVPSFEKLKINGSVEKMDPESVVKHECLSKLKRIKRPRERFSMTLLHIRHRKMKKHKLLKFRKRYLSLIKKVRMKRNIKKEKAFRVEILAKIKEAENFDPKQYIENMLNTIQNAPKPMTKEERLEHALNLIKIHRSENHMFKPRFADPVPPHDVEKLNKKV